MIFSSSLFLCTHMSLSLISLFPFVFFLIIRRPPISTLFPTRRSSDLLGRSEAILRRRTRLACCVFLGLRTDRKSTRLNSSHTVISYAVFCLKKKKDYLAICSRLR